MKQFGILLLLLCLLLTGCGVVSDAGDETVPALPTLSPVGPESDAATDAPGEEALPVLDTRNYARARVIGPAGSVYGLGYQGNTPRNPVYGDLDDDGRTELVYRTPGARDGKKYEVLTVYGLADGWPIQMGEAFLCLGEGEAELTAEDGRVFYSYRGGANDGETVRLPVTLEDGRLWVNGGELPEGLEFLSNRASYYGSSWQALKQEVSGRALSETEEYLLWKEPSVLYTQTELEEEEGLRSLSVAAVSDDGATVTGLVYWYVTLEGEPGSGASSFLILPLVETPEDLVGLTEKELIARLGDPWLERLRTETFAALCWFTEDGKLLTVQLEDRVVSATLTDLPISSD